MRLATALVVLAILPLLRTDYVRPAPEQIEVARGIYLFVSKPYGDVGMDGNSVAILSRDGVLVFDTNATPASSALVLATILLFMTLLKPVNIDAAAKVTIRFDLTLRMLVSAAFVLLITFLTGHVGAKLSGLLAPFPVFVLILSVFTHHQMGPGAASNLVRGVIIGSFSFAAFFAVVAVWLDNLGIAVTYSAAALASAMVSGVVYLILHRSTASAA